MTRLKLFLAALAVLLPLPAFADITGHYLFDGKVEFTVEVASDGKSRIDVPGKLAIIGRDGTDYLIMESEDGPKVFLLRDMIGAALPKEARQYPEAIAFGIAAGKPVTVAGQQGAGWLLKLVKGPDADRKKQIEFALSADPGLAPIGDVFRRTVAPMLDASVSLFPVSSGFGARVADLLAKGTPLRVMPIDTAAARSETPVVEFKSLDTAPIGAARFELPAPVTPVSDLAGAG
ncbi:MAG TPA: hypothetical protein VM662_03660, partial [Sphingomonas sp.]|nr:hypothetical protein [Sphingomonas sp.]